MAGSTIKKNTKRKHSSSSSKLEKPIKKTHISDDVTQSKHPIVVDDVQTPEKMELDEPNSSENHQWSHLELVLSIQTKDINSEKKVELIFDFVISRAIKQENGMVEEFNTLSTSRLILYISNWIQSLLITSEKKARTRDRESEESQFCLDYRCWQILKFCLEESLKLRVSLSVSRDLLRVIAFVAKSTFQKLNHVHTNIEKFSLTTTDCQMYNSINDCLKLLFSSHGQLLNGNLDLWTVTVTSLLELVIKTFTDNLQGSDMGNLITELSCLVLDQFSKFLSAHPCRKNGFRDFTEKLLEPLLHLLGMLPEQKRDGGSLKVQDLFSFVQEIVSNGLFHFFHLDEYLSLHGTEKYSSVDEWKADNARTLVKSYLRHLFEKLENLVSERKVHALSGVGEMFRLFVNCVKKHKRDSPDSDASRLIGNQSTKDSSKIGNLTVEKSKTSGPSCNMRKSYFDFFVLTTEPLLLDLRNHLKSEVEPKNFLLDVNFALKSVNTILSTMVRERIYIRTEDNSGGACLNFFKMSYGLLLSCYAKLSLLWNSQGGNGSLAEAEVLHSVAKEFVFVVTNFLEIEYEVIGDDLVNTWLMILTFLAMDHSSETLLSVAIDLGCRVVNLYSELRQVNHALFALCRGLRCLSVYQVNEIKSSEILPSDFSLHSNKFAKSGLLLLCSQQFRLVIRNAIKSIPEGQASEYVQTLSADISESLEWMKVTRPAHRESSVKAELFGMVLPEIYSLILESIPLTTGNSYRAGVSIENLIAVLRPSMTLLVAPEDVHINAFSFSVFGITSKKKMVKYKNDLQGKVPLLLLFFFRLYVSCRSSYRQTLSLMPPKSTKKMSGVRADLCTSYSGDDLLEMTDFEDESYFSWVIRPSSPLLSIIRLLKDSILEEVSACNSCLIYVMHIMTLQRLGDLKRQIQCVEYIVQRSENVISSKLLDDTDLSALRKKKKKQDKLLSCLKQEAASFAIFVMEYLPIVDNDKLQLSVEFDSWDLGVCTVNEKTLHTAVWWVVCQNIDIWCNYAAKENLKLFLSHLIYNSLECERDGKDEENTSVELNVTRRKISLDLLCDTNFYDQRFVCRYIVSTICDVFQKLALLLFDGSSNNDVELSSCDWTDALSVLSNTSKTTRKKPATLDCTSNDLADKCCSNQASSSQLNLYIGAAQHLLNLLCHMMEKALSSKSFSRCVIYLINFERLILGSSFMNSQGTLCLHEHFELLGLLVSCRRALRYLLITFCEKSEAYKSLNLGIFSESSSPYTWLLQSLNLVGCWLKSMSVECDGDQVNSVVVSLMDQTSYVFFTICKHDFAFPIHLALRPKEIKVSGDSEENLSTKPNSSSILSKDIKACESLARIVDALEVETKSIFPFPKGALKSGSLEADLTKLFSVVSCVQGLLWGLESALSDISTNYKDVKAKLMKHNYKTMSRIFDFLDIVVDFISMSSQIYLRDDHDMQNIENGSLGLNTDLLQSFLDGQNLEAAYVLRKVLISSSAIVRLSARIKCSPLSSNVVQTLLGCSEFLWTKFSQTLGMPNSSSIWLDGTVQFLEALGRQCSLTDAATTKDVFTKLVELNIKAIGKCISLQGKGATSASHDTESVTKLLPQSQALKLTLTNRLCGLDNLKTRLRKSFTVLIEKPSEMDLISVMQALQQALTGTRVSYSTFCDIQMGITDGGVVSSEVAAGVDCLDSLLENLKGNKLLTVVKTHMNGLIASLFNIVVHLQGPTLLYEGPKSVGAHNSPDSGSVVLMCVEVLTRIAGKSAVFHLESHHVSQLLHIPGTLFQSFHSLKQSKASEEYDSSGRCFPVHKQFSINLYAASCRLLWTIAKHHKSDCVRCIFLLQTSLQALLHCLEHVSSDKVDRKDFFTWRVEEGVTCATYLRRVYEEIRQQKDVFGQHSFKFLSDYVWVFSGHGSLKHGLQREIDEALRPGVYALIDVCSTDDLQHLHTVFGEGPRRSSLASLKHDYEHNFKYGGKV